MAYEISLEAFEGPLDLLLYLIQKNKIDIYDIPIAEITRQYLKTIKDWQDMDLEVASEFIVMASRLLEIKSRTLLPGRPEEEGEEDPRAQLMDQLVDYQTFKRIAAFLRVLETQESGSLVRDPQYIPGLDTRREIEVEAGALEHAFRNILVMYRDDHLLKSYASEIVRDPHTMEEKISLIRELFGVPENREIRFSQLLTDSESTSEVIVSFQALLELYKESKVQLVQHHAFDEIIVQRKE
jgi:segregation and condensation protein A